MSEAELLELEKDAAELTEHPELIDVVCCLDAEDKEEYLETLSGISVIGL